MLIRDQTPENEIHKIEKIYYSKPLESWIPVKENKEKKLLPFQTDVLSKLNTPLQYKKKVLLHLDTGLGKTFITLNLINQNRDKYLDKSVPINILLYQPTALHMGSGPFLQFPVLSARFPYHEYQQ